MIVYMFITLCSLQTDAEAIKQPRFKVKLMTITNCKLPESKWSPDRLPPSTFSIQKLNRETSILSWNFTIDRKVGPIFINHRAYQLQPNSAKNLVFKLERVSCTKSVTFKTMQMLNVNVTKDCFVLPGHYHYKNLDIDKLAWFLTRFMTVGGKYAYEVEFNDQSGVLACYYTVCDMIDRKQ